MPSIINATTSTGLVSSADNSGSLQLATNNGTTAVTIDTSQNVGIGTSSPAVKTEISGTAAASNLALRITNTATDGYSTIQMGDGNAGIYRNGSSQSGYAGASSLNLITVGAHNIGFATNNAERMRISSGGQVGIGKSPAVTLDVNGAINYDPNVSVNGLSVVSRATYDDGVNRSLGAAWNNTFGVITIKGTGGATNIPFFSNGGSGIGFTCTTLDPDAGTWSYGSAVTISWTTAGTGGNTFVLAFLGGSGTFELQRTSGSGSFTVVIQHYTT